MANAFSGNVTLTLTKREAQALQVALYHVGGDVVNSPRKEIDAVLQALSTQVGQVLNNPLVDLVAPGTAIWFQRED